MLHFPASVELSAALREAHSSPTLFPQSEFCTSIKYIPSPSRISQCSLEACRSAPSTGGKWTVPNLESEEFGKKMPAPASPGFCLEPLVHTTSCKARRDVPGGMHGKCYAVVLWCCARGSPSGACPKPRGHLWNRWRPTDL